MFILFIRPWLHEKKPLQLVVTFEIDITRSSLSITMFILLTQHPSNSYASHKI